MFNLFDTDGSGRIKRHLAHNLFKRLGIEVSIQTLSSVLTLRDLLLIADSSISEDTLEGDVKTFNTFLSQNPDGTCGDVKSTNIIEYCHCLGVLPPQECEAKIYLSALLDYDDCSVDPLVSSVAFQKDIVQACRQQQANANTNNGQLY